MSQDFLFLNEFNYSEGVIHFMHDPKNMFQIIILDGMNIETLVLR